MTDAPRILGWLEHNWHRIGGREPFTIWLNEEEGPYMTRTPLLEFKGVALQLHHFYRGDLDPDPHDHPWDFCSLILHGGYTEVVDQKTTIHKPGTLLFRRAETPHRITALLEPQCWTLVLHGPKRRDWGFHVRGAGWVPWKRYLGMET